MLVLPSTLLTHITVCISYHGHPCFLSLQAVMYVHIFGICIIFYLWRTYIFYSFSSYIDTELVHERPIPSPCMGFQALKMILLESNSLGFKEGKTSSYLLCGEQFITFHDRIVLQMDTSLISCRSKMSVCRASSHTAYKVLGRGSWPQLLAGV